MAADAEAAVDGHGERGNGSKDQRTSFPKPLKSSGTLEKFEYEDVTPCIGREFSTLNVVDDILNSPDCDRLIRDLAINGELRHTSGHAASKFDLKNSV